MAKAAGDEEGKGAVLYTVHRGAELGWKAGCLGELFTVSAQGNLPFTSIKFCFALL